MPGTRRALLSVVFGGAVPAAFTASPDPRETDRAMGGPAAPQ